jgi:HTH-like domain
MMPLQGTLSIERMCQLAQVSRAGFYRSLQGGATTQEDMEVRSAIQTIAVEHRRRYGYRRITAELRRRGMLVNHKRVARIMHEDNLLAVQPRAFITEIDGSKFTSLTFARNMKVRCHSSSCIDGRLDHRADEDHRSTDDPTAHGG